jgi:hypothetical protein
MGYLVRASHGDIRTGDFEYRNVTDHDYGMSVTRTVTQILMNGSLPLPWFS